MKIPSAGVGIEIVEGSGRCMMLGCGVRGGGLIRFQRQGKTTIVLCGDHLDRALDVLFEVKAEAEARAEAGR